MDPVERERLRELKDISRTDVRSQRRDSLKRRELTANALAALDEKQIAKLQLEPKLLEDVRLFARLGNGPALARQRRQVTRTLGEYDFEEIEQKLAVLDGNVRNDAHHHRVERLLGELLEGSDDALTNFLTEHPDVDRQHLRQTIRAAKTELDEGKRKRKRTALFRMLRDARSPTRD